MFEYAPRSDFSFQPINFNNFYKPNNNSVKAIREQRDPDIYVNNILKNVSEQQLRTYFSQYGSIAGMKINQKNNASGKHIGQLAYIWCKTPEDRDSILSNVETIEKDPESKSMFFIRPLISLFKKSGERKEQSPPQQSEKKLIDKLPEKFIEKLPQKLSGKPISDTQIQEVKLKDYEKARDVILDVLLTLNSMTDEKLIETLQNILNLKIFNFKILEYVVPNGKTFREKIEEIHKIMSEY